jgi:hypothetical protein
MKTILLVLLLGGATSGFAAGGLVPRAIPMERVPAPVQEALEQLGVSPQEVERVFHNVAEGRTVYDFEVRREGELNPRVLFAEDGTLLRDGRRAAQRTSGQWPRRHPDYRGGIAEAPAKMQELPAVVQEAIRQHAAGQDIASIDTQDWQGVTVYEVEVKQEGLNQRFHVRADGALLRDEQFAREVRDRLRDLAVEELPAAVQATIEQEVESLQQIIAINPIRLPVGADYRVTVRGDNIAYELFINESGEIMQDTRAGTQTVLSGGQVAE